MKLKYDINAIAEFDEISPVDFLHLTEHISEAAKLGNKFPIKMADLRRLVHAGLLHNKEDLTLQVTGEIMEEYLAENDFDSLVELVADALLKSTIFQDQKKTRTPVKTQKVKSTVSVSVSENG